MNPPPASASAAPAMALAAMALAAMHLAEVWAGQAKLTALDWRGDSGFELLFDGGERVWTQMEAGRTRSYALTPASLGPILVAFGRRLAAAGPAADQTWFRLMAEGLGRPPAVRRLSRGLGKPEDATAIAAILMRDRELGRLRPDRLVDLADRLRRQVRLEFQCADASHWRDRGFRILVDAGFPPVHARDALARLQAALTTPQKFDRKRLHDIVPPPSRPVHGALPADDVAHAVAVTWHRLPPMRTGRRPDLTALLDWAGGLASLRGRRDLEEDLRQWATGDGQPATLSLRGPRGSGKHRLAAELAESLRRAGWAAGFVAPGQLFAAATAAAGLLLIADEGREPGLSALPPSPPVRLLVLGDSAAAAEGEDRTLAPLAPADAAALFAEALANTAAYLDRPSPSVAPEHLAAWLAAEAHRWPLAVTACAVHAALTRDGTVTLDAAAVADALHERGWRA